MALAGRDLAQNRLCRLGRRLGTENAPDSAGHRIRPNNNNYSISVTHIVAVLAVRSELFSGV
jgi:hypothetical protein